VQASDGAFTKSKVVRGPHLSNHKSGL